MVRSHNIPLSQQKLKTDTANVTQELSKLNDGTNVIKDVLDPRNFCLKLEPLRSEKDPWEIMCFSNSEYSVDPISKKSVSRFVL